LQSLSRGNGPSLSRQTEQAYYFWRFAGRNTAKPAASTRGCSQSSHVSYWLVATCQQATANVFFFGRKTCESVVWLAKDLRKGSQKVQIPRHRDLP